jgi:hypothetical protein
MNRADRRSWAQARTLADLGELVTAWLRGEITQTPGHLGPPDPETTPLIPALTLANRAAFVTDNSQAAGSNGPRRWEAWVTGFASDATLARLRAAAAGTPLLLTACRGREHHCQWRRCPRREVLGFWADRCRGAWRELDAAWWVRISDPAPERNDRLWPLLEDFAASRPAPRS